MKLISLDARTRSAVNMADAQGVWKQVPVGAADGTPHFSLRVFTVEPGGFTPYHTHPSEHLNYIIAGEGVLVDGEGRERPLQQGDFALILPHEKHRFRNTSPEKPLVFICAVPKEYE
ncbi:MAG: cupin domain-containing protein [Syntrophales bacterium]|nr:cupin domain-containing protein [Syntrophales bacterium]